MINKKNLFTILVFLALTVLVLYQASTVNQLSNSAENFVEKENLEKSYFKSISFYSIENGTKHMNLDSLELEILTENGHKDMTFQMSYGTQFNNSKWMNWKADNVLYLGKSNELNLEGNVELNNETVSYKSSSLYYNVPKQFIEAKQAVKTTVIDQLTNDKIEINANYMTSWAKEQRILFLGNIQGKLKRKLRYEPGLKFSSEKLEYQQIDSQLILEKNVNIDRNNYHLESQKAEIFLDNYNKKLKYYVLYDDIKLEELLMLANGKKQIRKAFSEKLEGHLAEGKTILSGAPRVEQGDDVIKGYQITLRENVEIVEVDDSQSSFRLKKEK